MNDTTAPDPAPARADDLDVVELERGLSDDWDDVFAWSYGQRLWNVGCG